MLTLNVRAENFRIEILRALTDEKPLGKYEIIADSMRRIEPFERGIVGEPPYLGGIRFRLRDPRIFTLSIEDDGRNRIGAFITFEPGAGETGMRLTRAVRGWLQLRELPAAIDSMIRMVLSDPISLVQKTKNP